jgi:hypothetical protein
MSFLDQLDKALGLEEKKPDSVPIGVDLTPNGAVPLPSDPEDEFDTPQTPDPDAIPKPVDPFALMLDQALTAEGVDVQKEMLRRYNPTSGNTQEHDWQMYREKLFNGEPYIFKCKRCLKAVHVDEEQTINQALEEDEIDPNCGAGIVNDMMNM